MGQDPEVIRQEIEETRERMGETVDALGYKADVKERTKDYVSERRDAVTGGASSLVSKVAEAADSVVGRIPGVGGGSSSSSYDYSPSGGTSSGVMDSTKQVAQKGKGMVQENPLGLGIAGAAVGFLLGLALPSTRVENERVGPMADEVKQKAVETGQEALEHGKQIAQETVGAAKDAAQTAVQSVQEAGSEHAQELAESAKSHASDLKDTAKDNAQDAASSAREGMSGSGGTTPGTGTGSY